MFHRYAILVDAGYLFAQGSVCLTGRKQPRQLLKLKLPEILRELIRFAKDKTDASLLRIYWYDAAFGEPSREQTELAYHDDVKLRLGTLNNRGQQKGVDSLIVTDLVTLAQNKAISDAILLTGDEDIRVGVQLAQPHGIRVHLLGIHPARGSQSNLLRQEADSCSVWHKEDIEKVLETAREDEAPSPSSNIEDFDEVIHHVLGQFPSQELKDFANHMKKHSMLPNELDKRLLAHASSFLKNGAYLTSEERRTLRLQTRALLLAMQL